MAITLYGHAATQFRHPLQTSCWMNTVSNSVRMMAPVGQTSMQLACLQCLHTSDIRSQAVPLPVVALWSGTCSMNWTCRQFCASSCPVLSKLSARNVGGLPSSWFHSLQATSQALQPMQMLVSVKNPYCSPGVIVVGISEAHQVGRDLGVAALSGHEVEGHGGQLVNDRNDRRIVRAVDSQHVLPARVTGF